MDASWLFFPESALNPKHLENKMWFPTTPLGTKISSDAMSEVERLPFILRAGNGRESWFTISLSTKSQVPPFPNEKAGPPGPPHESLGSGEVANPTWPASVPPIHTRGWHSAGNVSLGTGETHLGPAPDMSPSSSSHRLQGHYYRDYQPGLWNLTAPE